MPFEVTGASGGNLRGETIGEGPSLVLCHGLSATRRYVVHGSLYLPRHGYRLVTYDARGHGESDPVAGGYAYGQLAADLDRVISDLVPADEDGRLLLGGHSMGCHTVAAWALANPGRAGALILAGPAYTDGTGAEHDLRVWDARADALANGGPEGFAREMVRGMEPGDIRDRIYHLARDRAALHHSPDGVVEALRQLPRSRPFGTLADLARIDVPVLVVGTRDEIDPTHPLATAEAWCEAIPGAELAVESAGEPPLTWQGGRLSREIARFLARATAP